MTVAHRRVAPASQLDNTVGFALMTNIDPGECEQESSPSPSQAAAFGRFGHCTLNRQHSGAGFGGMDAGVQKS